MNDLLSVNNLKIINKETGSSIINIDNFVLNNGEQAIFFGSNGAGKSTFLKAFCTSVGNDYSQTSGSIILNAGNRCFDLLHLSREELVIINKLIVYVGQEEKYGFGFFDSVIESLSKKSLEFADKDQICSIKQKATDLAIKYLDEIYIHDKKYTEINDEDQKRSIAIKILNKKMAKDCSSGQKKMICILRAILFAGIYKSSLLVLDEPLNHLDYKNKKIVNSEIQNLISNNKELSILIITHCLIFDFIDSKTCSQYIIERVENKNFISKISDSRRRNKINCLEEC